MQGGRGGGGVGGVGTEDQEGPERVRMERYTKQASTRLPPLEFLAKRKCLKVYRWTQWPLEVSQWTQAFSLQRRGRGVQ